MGEVVVELLFKGVEMVVYEGDGIEEILDDVVMYNVGLVKVYCYWLGVVVDYY